MEEKEIIKQIAVYGTNAYEEVFGLSCSGRLYRLVPAEYSSVKVHDKRMRWELVVAGIDKDSFPNK